MLPSSRYRGFTVVEILVTVLILAFLIALLLPALGAARRTARSMSNNTQLRGIHQGMVSYGAMYTNKGASDMFYPGLDRAGHILPDGEATAYSGEGSEPAARLAIMLNGNFFPPDYIISPADTHTTEAGKDQRDPDTGDYRGLTHEHHSYALLGLVGDENRIREWEETLNPNALVISDRAVGTGPGDISSVWTEPGSGDWRGVVARNDNSTSFETTHFFEDTQYGEGAVNAVDDLFADEAGADEAFLVHADAVTAYSVE